MATKINESVHKKIAAGLGDSRVSPAVLARLLMDENRYINESFMQYMINYIIIMANATHVPMHLAVVHEDCKILYSTLQELGLTGTIGREPVDKTEYLAV